MKVKLPYQTLIIMDPLLYTIIIGAIIGWLAGQLWKGHGFGIVGNIIVGILGSVVGGWVFGKTGISIGGDPLISTIITGVIGAIVLLFIIGLIKK